MTREDLWSTDKLEGKQYKTILTDVQGDLSILSQQLSGKILNKFYFGVFYLLSNHFQNYIFIS